MSNQPTKSALVVRGGWDGHAPIEATDMFIPFLRENGYDVRIEDSPEIYADAGYLATVDLIMQTYTMGTITPEALKGLIAAVENGTGLAGWHGGIADSFRNSSDYLHFVGGQFATHPGKHPDERVADDPANNYLPYTVNIVPEMAEHPIVAGISDFELTTEQYWVLSDSYNEVLATTTHPTQPYHPWHETVTVPAVWTRRWGSGRIFVATPGHSVDILENPNVRTIIERGLLWASR